MHGKRKSTRVKPIKTITYKGETLKVKEWADRFGITYPCMQTRLEYNWSMERIETTPTRKRLKVTYE